MPKKKIVKVVRSSRKSREVKREFRRTARPAALRQLLRMPVQYQARHADLLPLCRGMSDRRTRYDGIFRRWEVQAGLDHHPHPRARTLLCAAGRQGAALQGRRRQGRLPVERQFQDRHEEGMAGLASARKHDRARGRQGAQHSRITWRAAPTIRSAPAPCISGGTMFRIHGTNNAASIGGAVSSGCIRMMNCRRDRSL